MADFLKINNAEAVRVSSISSITADPHVQNITFRSDGKDFMVRTTGMPATLELGLKIFAEAEKSQYRIATIEDIIDTMRRAIRH